MNYSAIECARVFMQHNWCQMTCSIDLAFLSRAVRSKIDVYRTSTSSKHGPACMAGRRARHTIIACFACLTSLDSGDFLCIMTMISFSSLFLFALSIYWFAVVYRYSSKNCTLVGVQRVCGLFHLAKERKIVRNPCRDHLIFAEMAHKSSACTFFCRLSYVRYWPDNGRKCRMSLFIRLSTFFSACKRSSVCINSRDKNHRQPSGGTHAVASSLFRRHYLNGACECRAASLCSISSCQSCVPLPLCCH